MGEGMDHIIVNNEAGSAIIDGVDDLTRYMDMRSQGKTSVSALASELKSILASSGSGEPPLPAETQKVFTQIAEHTPVLLNSPPSEFEAAFNIHWYVLSSAPEFDSIIPIVLSKLSASQPTLYAQQLALLAVLGSLFNITSSQSPQKPAIFAHILDLAILARSTDQIISQLPQLAEWLRGWHMTDEAKVGLVSKLIDSAGSRHREAVRTFLTSMVTHSPELPSVATLLLSSVLRDPTAYKLDSVLTLPGVQALRGKSDGLYETVLSINAGDYAGFAKINSSFSSLPLAVKKAKIATVARLCSSVKGKLPYSDIVQALNIPESEVEPVIVDTIKVGLVKGRMNQLLRVFYVESANIVGEVTEHHWDAIEERLAHWKKSLNAIVDVTNRARSNYDLVKTLNKLEVN